MAPDRLGLVDDGAFLHHHGPNHLGSVVTAPLFLMGITMASITSDPWRALQDFASRVLGKMHDEGFPAGAATYGGIMQVRPRGKRFLVCERQRLSPPATPPCSLFAKDSAFLL